MRRNLEDNEYAGLLWGDKTEITREEWHRPGIRAVGGYGLLPTPNFFFFFGVARMVAVNGHL